MNTNKTLFVTAFLKAAIGNKFFIQKNKQMRLAFSPILGLFIVIVFCLSACQPTTTSNHQNEQKNGPLLITSKHLVKVSESCKQSAMSECARIDLSYPNISKGPASLRSNVQQWSRDFIISLLDKQLEFDEETTLHSAVEGYFEMYQAWRMEHPDKKNDFRIETRDTVLFQDEQYLSLRIDAQSFGISPQPFKTAAIATFNKKSGTQVRPIDLVQDMEALYVHAAKKLEAALKADSLKQVNLSGDWPFVLAKNVGLTTEGLFFCYMPYELGPYSEGFTEFVIPYIQLEKL